MRDRAVDHGGASNGQPLLLRDSRGICAPTGAPLIPIGTQTRVTGA